jgi:sialic acid synthase SpsE
MKIKVREGLEIGDDSEPFIIAEVGSNWTSFEDCKNAVAQAKLAGADAVKFQLFDSPSLWGLNDPLADELSEAMPASWIPKLAEKAKACGIEFMCTAFSPELYDVVNPYVSIHKIASSELSHKRILEKVRSYGKPVILSCGAATEGDIRRAIDLLGNNPTILMYCVGAYPARLVDPTLIPIMKEKFNKLVGYSDHTTDVMFIPGAATKSLGACVLEKHVTFIDAVTPDKPHSLTGDEFKLMVKAIKKGFDLPIGPTREERDMVVKYRRRLIALIQINSGDEFIENKNFGIYRSLKEDTRAMSGFDVDKLNGKKSKIAISPGDGIGPFDFE